MHAHANDLRAEVARDWETLTGQTSPPGEAALDAFVHGVVDDWRTVQVTAPLRLMLDWTARITRTPAACSKRDIAELQNAGWSDAAIHDAAQVVAYFNYINRIADALGVKEEPGMRLWGKTRLRDALRR